MSESDERVKDDLGEQIVRLRARLAEVEAEKESLYRANVRLSARLQELRDALRGADTG